MISISSLIRRIQGIDVKAETIREKGGAMEHSPGQRGNAIYCLVCVECARDMGKKCDWGFLGWSEQDENEVRLAPRSQTCFCLSRRQFGNPACGHQGAHWILKCALDQVSSFHLGKVMGQVKRALAASPPADAR